MANERIELTDSVSGALIKMSEGNPGALTTLIQIMKESPKIDPDDFMGALGPV